jgi:hypothetical protein
MVRCPYCTQKAELVRGYAGKPVWQCAACDARVGCHPGTNKPLGRLANAELRAWRIAAHEAFDPMWQRDGIQRGVAYGLLASWMGMPKAHCHIGRFDVAQCIEVVQVMACLRPESREVA